MSVAGLNGRDFAPGGIASSIKLDAIAVRAHAHQTRDKRIARLVFGSPYQDIPNDCARSVGPFSTG
jgi:hypothetical protein